jgi:hypothetical protein
MRTHIPQGRKKEKKVKIFLDISYKEAKRSESSRIAQQ